MTSHSSKISIISIFTLITSYSIYDIISGGSFGFYFLVISAVFLLWIRFFYPWILFRSNRRRVFGIAVSGEKRSGESEAYVNWRDGQEMIDMPYGSVYEALCDTVERIPERECYGVRDVVKVHREEKEVDGVSKVWETLEMSEFHWISYREFKNRVDAFGSGLRALGLNPGDKLSIYEDTRMEWTIGAFGCLSQNIIVMTVYSNLGEENIVHALNQAEITYILTNGKLLSRILSNLDAIEHLKTIIYLDEAKEENIEELEQRGLQVLKYQEVVDLGNENMREPEPQNKDTLALIMYTSGSTGTPKGVMIKNKNFMATINGVTKAVDPTEDDVYLSFLPLAHILAFDVESALLCRGSRIGTGTPRTLVDSGVKNCRGDIAELRPTVFVGVPSILTKIMKTIESKVESQSGLKQMLFKRAISDKVEALKYGTETPIWDKLIINKMKQVLGGRLRLILSGGAPLSAKVAETLRGCFGIPVIQGYALTETCGGGTVMELTDFSLGEAGPPIVGVKIKLIDCPDMGYTSEDKPYPRGEICIKGDSVVDGYYKNPELTDESFIDGWFHTGDIGCFLPNGNLKIIDRKKNLIKPPHGEYIAVEQLESIYKDSQLVEHICVYASSDYNEVVALVHPNKSNLESWAKNNDMENLSWEELCKDERAEREVLSDLGTINTKSKVLLYTIISLTD
eukprot:TRINITY_DN2299_c0_g1_i1.p1 TRINITY_DN2299_c0_g1~~TRINITY_DN2299_c0_g1_i1.p1  ORF type:complete len:695 (-),score=137.67 TRINITY_DN2299_c0_g1_i1:172-2220(-)